MSTCPSGKVRHTSEAAAKRAAIGAARHRTHDRPRVYQCPTCAGGWHLTSAPPTPGKTTPRPTGTPTPRRRRGRGRGAPPTPPERVATTDELDAFLAQHRNRSDGQHP